MADIETANSANCFVVELRQEDLGSLLGVTRQSVSKELSRLQAEALVRMQYGRIILLNVRELAKVAESG